MPLIQYAELVNHERVETLFYQGDAKLLQLVSKKFFSRDHILSLEIYKYQLFEGCRTSSKLFPLVVALWERDGQKRLNDFYSFDNNGILLSHGYSRWENEKPIVSEQHDLSLERLVEHGATISEMILEYPIPAALAMHKTVIDLQHNMLRQS